jgi:hypothetical protein
MTSSPSSFPYATNFPSLYGTGGPVSAATAPLIDAAIASVCAEWSGCFDSAISGITGTTGLWQVLGTAIAEAKQTILLGYLVAWWLADMYPTALINASGDGGMPLTSKSIGGVSISRKDLEAQPALKQLESNVFGIKALEMIVSAPERYQLHGRIRSWGPPVGNMPGVGI